MLFNAPPKAAPLNHVKVTQSLQGLCVPLVIGTARIAGKLIYDADLVAHSVSTSGKAKGGKSGQYAYTGTFIAALCEGPILGVLQVWNQTGILPMASGDVALGPIPTGPAAPQSDAFSLSYTAGGSLPARTYWACITYLYGNSESAATQGYSWAIPADNLATVAALGFPAPGPTSWRVYVGASASAMTLQATISVSGGNWTEPSGGISTTGPLAPTQPTVPVKPPPTGPGYGGDSGVKGPGGKPFRKVLPTF